MDWGYVLDLLREYGYLIILGWTFLEGETVVIVAGFAAASHGIFNPWLVALCAFLGSFCSDQLMFSLGKYKGASVLKRFPRLNKNSEKARRLLLKYETPLILGFRFVYGVRNVTPILLGISGVSHLKFVLLNMIGGSVWALTFSFGGFFFGEMFQRYAGNIKHAEGWIIGGIALLAVVLFILHRYRNKMHAKQAITVAGVEMPPEKSILLPAAPELAVTTPNQEGQSPEGTTPEATAKATSSAANEALVVEGAVEATPASPATSK